MSQYPAVLYVEDDASSRNILEVILTTLMGLTELEIFEDSMNFEHRLGMLPFIPDIVMLDIHMEPLDGFEMLRILRAQPAYQNCPIVALTASVMNDEIAQLRDAGFNGVISKPINIDIFMESLQQLLDGKEVWRIA